MAGHDGPKYALLATNELGIVFARSCSDAWQVTRPCGPALETEVEVLGDMSGFFVVSGGAVQSLKYADTLNPSGRRIRAVWVDEFEL